MYTKVSGAADKHQMDVFMYEVDMVNVLPTLMSKQASLHLNNSVVESFLIHVRALKDFFEGKHKYEDDLTCLDFKNRNGDMCEIQIVDLGEDFKEVCNKSIAHITTTRLLHKIFWDPLLIRLEINRAAYRFLSSCAPEEFPTEEKRIEYIGYFDRIRKVFE